MIKAPPHSIFFAVMNMIFFLKLLHSTTKPPFSELFLFLCGSLLNCSTVALLIFMLSPKEICGDIPLQFHKYIDCSNVFALEFRYDTDVWYLPQKISFV